MVEQHVVGHDGPYPRLRGEVRQPVQPQLVARPPPQRQRAITIVAEDIRDPTELPGAGRVGLVGDEDADQPLSVGSQVFPAEDAPSLAATALAERQQPAEPGVGGAIGRIDQHGGAVAQVETAADDQPDAGDLGRLVAAHDSGQAVPIAYRQRLDPGDRRLAEQLLAGRRPAQEAEVRRALEFSIAHANRPCRNQRCEPVPRSRPSPARNSQKRSPSSHSA